MRIVALVIDRMLRSLRNTYRSSSTAERLRFLVIAILGSVVLCLIYLGTLKFQIFLDTQITFGYLTPSVLLSLVLSVVSLFTFFLSLAHLTGSLSQNEDVDLLYSFPLSPTELFLIRAIETAIQTSWMSFILCLPLLAAVAHHVGAPAYFMLFAAVLVLVLLVSIASLGATCGIVLVRIFPPALVGRYLGLAIALTFGSSVVLFLLKSGQINPIVSIIHAVSSPFLPSSWIGSTLGELALKSPLSVESYQAWFFFLIFSLSTGIFLAEVLLYKASSRALERPSKQKRSLFLLHLTAALPDPQRGIVLRELAFLLRNPSTLVHLLFLSGLALGYGSIISRVDLRQLPVIGNPRIWNMALLGGNLAIAGYLATVFLSRLVLPMTSLEGRAVWLSAVAPISSSRVLRIRRVMWCVPTCVLTVGICMLNFGIGAAGTFDLSADPLIKTEATIMMVLLSWVLVSVAVASGAQFARFDWSHPGELIASFGSLVFMTLAVLLTTVLAFSLAIVATGHSPRSMIVLITLGILSLFLAEFLMVKAAKDIGYFSR